MYLVPMPKNSKRMLGYQDFTNADGLINQNKHVSRLSTRNIMVQLTRNDKRLLQRE